MPPFLWRQSPGRPQNEFGGKGFRSDGRGAALVVALLFIGCLLLLGSAILTIGASERQIGLNDLSAAKALYLA